jgi:hypothetical protein
MSHLETKLKKSLSGTKGARTKASLFIDTWDEADEWDKEQVYTQWAEQNRSPYGGRVNRALLSVVPNEWWTHVAQHIAEGIKYEDEQAIVRYGLELTDRYDPNDERERELLIMTATEAMWAQIAADIVDAWKANEDLGVDDLPWQIDPEEHGIVA